jgi:D-3-phosphoglycerate dehydrogenase / 2-oxoglutarate reductase
MQNVFERFSRRFDERGIAYDLPPVVQQSAEDELIAIIGDYDGMIAGDDPLSERVLSRAKRMRIISKWGVGTDGIDLDAARSLGIAVTNTPGVFGEDVADVAAGYLVVAARQLHRIHDSVVDGGWFKYEGVRLAGMTLGIAGYGSVGAALTRRGVGFGMTVIAHDVDESARERATSDGVEAVGLEELFRRSDFLVLCLPLTDESRRVVDRRRLALMPHGSILVNVARGGLVDEEALVEALATGRLSAVALDVFAEEPLPIEHPLRRFPQCVFGSHNASNTREGVLRTSEIAVENLLNGLDSE